ncbi:hypothetical protein POTOM_005633 [Populus tomentosa]|uniref:Uncharacterized protein n=1 Tax=Populus tomentosa TaxID=118781 RepID=A0A8X8DE98_POPTO|nr:hypothetical protein POTOM_005633 [Populus tomentosa]
MLFSSNPISDFICEKTVSASFHSGVLLYLPQLKKHLNYSLSLPERFSPPCSVRELEEASRQLSYEQLQFPSETSANGTEDILLGFGKPVRKPIVYLIIILLAVICRRDDRFSYVVGLYFIDGPGKNNDNAINAAFCLETAKLEKGRLCFGFTFPAPTAAPTGTASAVTPPRAESQTSTCVVNPKTPSSKKLVGNKISGKIPANIGNLQRLTVLNLADNGLTGEIPSSLTKLPNMKHLDLSNNMLTGQLPSDFGNLKMLSRALLSKNQLSGAIPSSISVMYRLADLDLSVNQLSGWLPDWIGSMPVLSTLNLDSNMISGPLPQSLLSSTGLGMLNLSKNAIEGNIPDAFGPKSYFMALDLSYNNLKGPIPSSLSSAAYVGYLDLSHNHLCGPIPVGSPFDHLEASSYSFNYCLCGNPLRAC